jgi:peptidyl-dipeptidase A
MIDYDSYVRAKLKDYYGPDYEGHNGLIPEHLTTNMWAQEWSGLLPILTPYPQVASLDVSDEMVAQGYDIHRVHQLAESW